MDDEVGQRLSQRLTLAEGIQREEPKEQAGQNPQYTRNPQQQRTEVVVMAFLLRFHS